MAGHGSSRLRGGATAARVLAAGGLDQPVERVVGVVVARLDALVAEVDGLLRVVLDVGDVAGGVVGVVQVLHAAGPLRTRGVGGVAGAVADGNDAASRRVNRCVEPERLGVVRVARRRAVAELQTELLALGVVGDLLDRLPAVAAYPC